MEVAATDSVPPGQTTDVRDTAPEQTPPGTVHPPWADFSLAQCKQGYGQQAGGTHPTGMRILSYDTHIFIVD